MDWGVFCKDTITGEASANCLSSIFQIGTNTDPTYLDWLLKAWGWTLLVAVLSLFIALVLGTIMGTLRTIPTNVKGGRWMVGFATVWVEVFRNIPVLVQVFVWYHVVPNIFPVMKRLPAYWLVCFALGFYSSARMAEQVRAGIQSLSSGQRMAALALGLSTYQSYRYVILPVAYRTVWPTITSEAMNVFKNSAVLYALSVLNFFAYTKTMREETSQDIIILILSTPVYLIITYTIKFVMAWIEKRMAVPGLGSGGK